MSKVALVTGGDQGLGLAIKNQLLESGWKVIVIPGYEIKDELEPKFGEDSLDAARKLVPYGTTGYDLIINNWGINRLSWIGEEHKTGLDPLAILSHNVALAYSIVAVLVERGNHPAKVINVSSITHRVSQRCTAMYCASKAALVQLTRVQARELAPKGWQINCFAPGKIKDTLMSRLTDQQVLDLRGWDSATAEAYAAGNVPIGRFMDSEEAARNCLNILGFSNYVNGALIECTGGQ